MSELEAFLNKKIIDCEETFAKAGTNPDMIFLDGMLEHGGEINALLMVIGKRQAFTEILEYIRGGVNDEEIKKSVREAYRNAINIE